MPPVDVLEPGWSYDGCMTRVYLADTHSEERSALRLLLLELKMQVVGEADAWASALVQAPLSLPDMVVVDWSMLAGGEAGPHLRELRGACLGPVVIVLLSDLDAERQAALVTGADAFISKGEMADRIAERLRAAASGLEF